MRFMIKHVGCGRERVGLLTEFHKSPGVNIETPTAALITQGGSVVHLTAEVLAKVFTNPQLLWMPLSNSIHLENGVKALGQGVVNFAGLSGNIMCAAVHSIGETTPKGHFEMNKVPLWTKHGKKMLTSDRYMDVMEVFKPDIILAIADGRVTLDEGHKRISKAVERTRTLLDECVSRYNSSKELKNSALIGVVVSPGDSKKCEECVQHILKHKDSLRGISLEGLTEGSANSLAVGREKLEEIFRRVRESFPADFVYFIEGSWNPAVVVAAIAEGWDVFDGCYPLKLTNSGHALALNFNVSVNSEEPCMLDLNDSRYKDDFRPILENCECLTCKKHTRAYVQHLLNTREMLSSVLLSIHNLYHYDQLFWHARHHIEAKSYETYKQHITEQYELYQTSLETEKECEENKDNIIQINKKIRVSDSPNNVNATSS